MMSDSVGKVNSAPKPYKPLISPTAKPSKPFISPTSKPLISPTSPRSQGILVKKKKELPSPPKSISKVSTSVTKISSSKVTLKNSKADSEKKGKKVYDLPGQKHDPPEERDPLRIFYESLYHENPKSEMALIWMMEHGLLSLEAAKRALERKKKIQLNQKLGVPVKMSKGFEITSEKVVSKGMVVASDKKGLKLAASKSERVVAKGMVVTPNSKVFAMSNGDTKVLSSVKRKLDMGSDSDDDKPLKPKKKFSPAFNPAAC